MAFWLLQVAAPAFGAEIHPLILEEVTAGEAEFVIVLEEQADLGSICALRTKADRGRAVCESLTYLVRAVNDGGGSLGNASNGDPRDGPDCPDNS